VKSLVVERGSEDEDEAGDKSSAGSDEESESGNESASEGEAENEIEEEDEEEEEVDSEDDRAEMELYEHYRKGLGPSNERRSDDRETPPVEKSVEYWLSLYYSFLTLSYSA
jgi:hypothetical protein